MWPVLAVFGRPGAPVRPFGRWSEEDKAADEDTVRRIVAGESEAVAELYNRHSQPVFSLVSRIVADAAAAEDVMQEVFSQAWRQASRFDGARGSVGAWLLNIARSRAIDSVRAHRSQPDAGQLTDERKIFDLPGRGVSQEAAAITNEQVERLRTSMGQLPFLQRIAIELAYYEGLTQQEIAERLEQPLGTIKTRIRLGLMKLREAMAGVAT